MQLWDQWKLIYHGILSSPWHRSLMGDIC
jgi:hypothetical protein